MHSFRQDNPKLMLSSVWLMNSISEFKGKQELYQKQSPQILKSLGFYVFVDPYFHGSSHTYKVDLSSVPEVAKLFVQAFDDAGNVTIVPFYLNRAKGSIMIRVANHCAVELRDVSISFSLQTENYGNIMPDRMTGYRRIGKAYRYAHIRAIVNGEEAVIQPTLRLGFFFSK